MKVHLDPKPVLAVHRRILKKQRLVYFLVGAKPEKYEVGRSRIVYIGTTKKGARRIASSAAHRAQELLERRGIRKLHVYVVSCAARPGLQSWVYLERACLAEFRSHYGEPPSCNKQGTRARWNRKLRHLFNRDAVEKIILHFDRSNRSFPTSSI